MSRTTHIQPDDRLDDVLAEIERARHEPTWIPEEPRSPRRLIGAPHALEGARWSPSRPAIAIIVVCALIAAAVLGVRLLLQPDSSPHMATAGQAGSSARVSVGGTPSVASGVATATGTVPVGTAASPGSSLASATSSTMAIHVVGAVRHPGVVEVPAGSRVEDAVKAAGGLSGADATAINLARLLSDGEQVHVPRPGETIVPTAPSGQAAGASGAPTPGPGSAGGAGAAGTVNLNTADVTALDALPGVGPVLAQRIVDWRSEHGRFSSVDELGEVSGIGDKAMERLRSKVSV